MSQAAVASHSKQECL